MTSAQLATLKTDVQADSALNALPHNADSAYAIVAAYALFPGTDFFVYRTAINPQELFNGITWANLTPVDAPDGTQTWANRSLACQGKQFNVQILLQGQATVDASRTNVRAGLQDALTNIPSGAAGALLSAGWVTIRDAILARKANRLEKLFATGSGATAATAATMAVEGTLSVSDVLIAMGW